MGRLKIRNGWVEFYGNDYELNGKTPFKVGFAVKD
jgi:hypothetical protein